MNFWRYLKITLEIVRYFEMINLLNNYQITRNQCHICPLMQNKFQWLTLVASSMHSGQMCQGKPSITVISSNSLNLNQFFESEPILLQFLPKPHGSLLSGHYIISNYLQQLNFFKKKYQNHIFGSSFHQYRLVSNKDFHQKTITFPDKILRL